MSLLVAALLLTVLQSPNDRKPEPPKKLIEAAERGDVKKVQELIQDPTAFNPDKNGRTALIAAGEKGRKEAFAIMVTVANLRGKREAKQVAEEGQSAVRALMAAVQARMEFFNTANKDGLTPLMLAAAHGWDDVARALVDGGASGESVDNKGRSAADHAQARGFNALAQTLRSLPRN